MQTHIIIYGKNAQKADEVFEALKEFENWKVSAITEVETALEKMHRQKINMVIFTKDVQQVDINKLGKIGRILNDEIIFLHYGEHPSFRNRIVSLLNKQRLEREPGIAILDSVLKKANIFLN